MSTSNKIILKATLISIGLVAGGVYVNRKTSPHEMGGKMLGGVLIVGGVVYGINFLLKVSK